MYNFVVIFRGKTRTYEQFIDERWQSVTEEQVIAALVQTLTRRYGPNLEREQRLAPNAEFTRHMTALLTRPNTIDTWQVITGQLAEATETSKILENFTQFTRKCCQQSGTVAFSKLHHAYNNWANSQGIDPLGVKTFSKHLNFYLCRGGKTEAEIRKKTGSGLTYLDISLK